MTADRSQPRAPGRTPRFTGRCDGIPLASRPCPTPARLLGPVAATAALLLLTTACTGSVSERRRVRCRRPHRSRGRRLDGAHLLDRRHQPRAVHGRRRHRDGRGRHQRRTCTSVRFVDRVGGVRQRRLLGLDDWVGAKVLEVNQGGATELAEDLGPSTRAIRCCSPTSSPSPSGRTRPTTTPSSSPTTAPSWPGVGGDESADHDSLTLAEIYQAIDQGLDRRRRRQARPARVRRLPDGHLRGRQRRRAARRPDAGLPGARARSRLGLPRTAVVAGRGPGDVDADTLGTAIVEGFQAQAAAQGTEGRDHPRR